MLQKGHQDYAHQIIQGSSLSPPKPLFCVNKALFLLLDSLQALLLFFSSQQASVSK